MRSYGHNGVPVFLTGSDRFNIARYDLNGSVPAQRQVMIAAQNLARISLRIQNIGVSPANAFICNKTAIGTNSGYQLFGRPTLSDMPQTLDLNTTEEVWAICPAGATTTLIILEQSMDIAPVD